MTAKYELRDWSDIEGEYQDASALIGNGFSRNIYPSFGYESLYKEARMLDGGESLGNDLQGLFTSIDSLSFEEALRFLAITEHTLRALNLDSGKIRDFYIAVKRVLVAAVHRVHLTRPHETGTIAEGLSKFRNVYLTNYDLICYWAIQEGQVRFEDFFRGPEVLEFDRRRGAARAEQATSILYLHGGLHLRSDSSGKCTKAKKNSEASLLELVDLDSSFGCPLIVAEGTCQCKLRAIRRSDYLSFCFDRFCQDKRPFVVLGQQLAEQDRHLAQALNSIPDRSIAVSFYKNDSSAQFEAFSKRIAALLAHCQQLEFFDSRTHPLLKPELAYIEAHEDA